MRIGINKIAGSLRSRLAITMVGLTALAVMGMAIIAMQRLNAKISEDIEFRTLHALRVATRIYVEAVPILNIEKNAAGQPEALKLVQPASMLDNFSVAEMTRVVDQITEANHGTATIFRWSEEKKDFVRIATTVKKPDGSRAVGTVLGQNGVVYPYMMRKEAYRGIAQILGEAHQTGYLPIVDQHGKPAGILYIGIGKLSELAASTAHLMRDLILGSLLILGLSIVVTMLATTRILKPLGRVAEATNSLASGADNVDVPHRDRSDEVGVIARAVDGFREAVEAQRDQERRQVEEAAALAERKEQMDQIVAQFRDSVRVTMDRLRAGAEKVRETSSSIRNVANGANARVSEGRDAADNGASAISEVATATNQFASSITEIAARSNEAASVVRKASETGQHAETVASELSTVVERISSAVSFISSIASQTNLLALNATIEAARAGEAGKGFAVVASEVKELSNGTSKAAAEIAELVKSIESVTREVTDATREIGSGLTSINETTLVIAAAVTEQEQVTRDIAGNADAAAQRSDIVRSGFGEVQNAIENTVQAADSLDGLSKEFAASADGLVGEIEQFLNRMAA